MWRSSQYLVTVWFTRSLLNSIVKEANALAPNETGGVLMGYSDASGLNFVINQAAGPGPLARHALCSFTPDHEYQEQEIARLYRESGRTSTYLGDWHSHPGGGLYLSPTDRKTLARIALTKEARVHKPLMAVVGGPDWELAIWQGSMHYHAVLPPILRTNPCRLKFFTPGKV